jgi:hypothetical protein
VTITIAKAEADRIETERLADIHRLRIEAARPDVEKLAKLAETLRAIEFPEVATGAAKDLLDDVAEILESAAFKCERFTA